MGWETLGPRFEPIIQWKGRARLSERATTASTSTGALGERAPASLDLLGALLRFLVENFVGIFVELLLKLCDGCYTTD